MRILLWSLVLAIGATTLQGRADLTGLQAARALQIWWSARQFEAAALREDLDGLARLGMELARLGAGDAPLRFAAHRIGFQVTGESWQLPRPEAAHRALQGLQMLEAATATSDDPFEVRQTQAMILVNRLQQASFEPWRLRVAEEWLAAGGGPRHPLATPGHAYRAALQLPPGERSTFLIERFWIGPRGED